MRAGQPADWRPPRGYSWPAIQKGDQLALKHGAFSPRWARTEAIVYRLSLGLGETLDPESAALRQLDRWTSRAESARARLGLDPASWARLRHELAASEQALAQADAQRELQERYGRPSVLAEGE